jgi:hypothetical protein
MISTVKLSDFRRLSHSGPVVYVNRPDKADGPCPMETINGCSAIISGVQEKARHFKDDHDEIKLFVYIRHHLVIKTDIVISVDAQNAINLTIM